MDTRDGVTACNTVRLGGGPESLPAFFARAKIYFPLSLLALMDVWDNLSRIFRDKGNFKRHLKSCKYICYSQGSSVFRHDI